MDNIKTLRDELAVSLPGDLIPQIKDERGILLISEKLDIKVDLTDDMSMIDFIIQYQAIMRYKYADAMLAARVI
jgi:hypothetical protein